MGTTAMMETYPAEINLDRRRLAAAIDAPIECAEAFRECRGLPATMG